MTTKDPHADYRRARRAVVFAMQEWARQNIHTSMPGEIVAYDAATKRARVQPSLNAIIDNPETRVLEAVNRAPLWDCPVLWPGGGGFIFTSNLDRGDQVWLSFSERGIDLWKQAWSLADPPPLVMFEMRDAVAHPIGARTLTPIEGTNEGPLAEVTPSASGSRVEVPGATMQAMDGDPYVQLTQDKIVLKFGSSTVTMTGSEIEVSGPTETLRIP